MAVSTSPFGVYVHVPFCSTRCGYCDFNTYTAGELGSSASPDSYLDALERELALAAQYPGVQQADTVFVGGGTPSLLGAAGLSRILRAVTDSFGMKPDAEITTEANPESTSPEFFADLREAGFNRVSLGMQSASARVLKILDRKHTPDRPVNAAREAYQAGFDHINLDLIYGTPTEEIADVQRSVDAVLSTAVDHVSAYSLIVEDGTAMARKVRKGQLPPPSEDVYADRFELIDQRLVEAGFSWYEVSNWAKPGGQCRHNMGYWVDGDWWGAGPGAHSYVGDSRFFNVKHPARYAEVLRTGALPIKDSEHLSQYEHHTEKVMLGLRLRQGVPVKIFDAAALPVIDHYKKTGLLHQSEANIAVTEKGRLLADGIIADILLAED